MKRAVSLAIAFSAACTPPRLPRQEAPDERRVAAPVPTVPPAMPILAQAADAPRPPATPGTVLAERLLGGDAHVNGGAVALDARGNAYVVGSFHGRATFGALPALVGEGEDAFLLKLDPSLEPVWSKRIGGPSMEIGDDLAIDAGGGVYVSGAFSSKVLDLGAGALHCAGIHDLFLAKYDLDGNLAWAKRYGDALDQIDLRLRADPAGGVAVTGWYNGAVDFGGGAVRSPFTKSAFVGRIDANGKGRWGRHFGHRLDYAGTAAAFAPDGTLYVSGGSDGTAEFVPRGSPSPKDDLGPVLLSFDADGKRLSARRFGSGADNMSTAIGFDAEGGMRLVVGSRGVVDFGGGKRVAQNDAETVYVASFDAHGALLWDRALVSGALASVSTALVTARGDTYVAGEVHGRTRTGIGFLAKVDVRGELVWIHKLDRTPMSWIGGVAMDARGRIIASGTVHTGSESGLGGHNVLWVGALAP
jgi:hypothetical protein